MAEPIYTATLPTVSSVLEKHSAKISIGMFSLAWLVLYGPVYLTFMQTAWARPENAHAPFILAICAGLAFSQISSGRLQISHKLRDLMTGAAILVTGLSLCGWSRIQEVDLVLSASQIIVLGGIILMLYGWQGVRQMWFVFVLSFYLITWPGWAVDMVTFPLKMVVSEMVASMLYAMGLPVTHSGAIITAGAYELLVADACAGLNSLIALTSIGVVYLYIVRRASIWSNLINLLLLAPIAIVANMIRVALLVMITLFWGYDAGQSFLHDLSGLIMFGAALAGVFAIEALVFACVVVFSGRQGGAA